MDLSPGFKTVMVSISLPNFMWYLICSISIILETERTALCRFNLKVAPAVLEFISNSDVLRYAKDR